MSLGGARKMARGHQKKIDFKFWQTIPFLSSEHTTATTLLGGSLAFVSPATILRMRGYWEAKFDETAQAGDTMRVVAALGIISTDAFAAGSGSVPDPASEPEYPWLWWDEMFLEAIVTTATSLSPAFGMTYQRHEVDSKAMRKVKPGESLIWVAQTATVAGAPTTIISLGGTRTLIGI